MSLSQELRYTDEVSQVTSVRFSIMSPRKVLEQSVCEVYNHITSPELREGTLFDPRMGSSDRSQRNALSGLSMRHDPGNFGHINLAKPVIQYQFITQIIHALNSVCHLCSNILLDRNNASLVKGIMALNPKARPIFLEKHKEKSVCWNCGACVAKFSKDKDGVARLTSKTIITIPSNIPECDKEKGQKSSRKETRIKYVDPEVALNILRAVSDEDCQMMGYDPELARPDWMIWTYIPVPPPSMRPAVQNDAGQTADDDLTHKLNDIVKMNNQIRNLLEEQSQSGEDRTSRINSWWQVLQYHVATYIDNDISNVPKAVNRSGRAYKTLQQRLKAKEGRIRGNLMGKRVDGSARTVITPDPCISIDEIGVPYEILTNLTFKETVTEWNREVLTQLVRNGPNYPGAKCIQYKNLSRVEQKLGRCQYRAVLSYLSEEQRAKIVLRPGDIVYRHLMEGDWVLFNRQPSLHKMSMMGHRIRPRRARSFGLNINVTQPYGADFDGDEMNIFVASSLQSSYELRKLAAVPQQIVSPQASRPVMGLVQDSLLGVYLITRTDRPDYHRLNLMGLMKLVGWMDNYQGQLPSPSQLSVTGKDVTKAEEKGENPVQTGTEGVMAGTEGAMEAGWDGRTLISIYFPKISYYRENEDKPEDSLRIQNGQIVSGYFDKSSFGAKAGSVIHVTWNDYGPETTRHLFDNTMNTACQWLLIDGFSVGLADTHISQEAHQNIGEGIHDRLVEAKLKIDYLHKGWYPILGEELQKRFMQDLTQLLGKEPPEVPHDTRFMDTGKPVYEQFELDIYTVLDEARSVAEKETNKNLQKVSRAAGRTNRMESMVTSGSKGSKTNLVQIVSLLGQQAIDGGRVPEEFNRRTLPHFYKDNLSPEGRGFIENSFLDGLNPAEYWFHTMAGRIGVILTSIKTAETGYLQRRLVKIMEDVIIKYDGTARNANDMIMQYHYGGDGFDASQIEPSKLDYLEMTHSKFQDTYSYTPSMLTETGMLAMITPESYQRMAREEGWEQVLQSEFTDLSYDREERRSQGVPDKMYSPVNFVRLLKNYKYRYNLQEHPVADISPTYVVREVRKLVRELVESRRELLRTDQSEGETPVQESSAEAVEEFPLFASLIRSHLSSRKILAEHYNQEAFDFLMSDIRRQYYKSLITPGEMVGAIAAQSIGEPATQLTLDTFHRTGIGAGANVARGVPRLKEILRVAQTLATPSMEVYLEKDYLRPENGSLIPEQERKGAYLRAEEVAANLEYTVLRDLIHNIQILYDSSDCQSVLQGDQGVIDAYYQFMPEECRPPESEAPWLLRIQFREDEMYQRGISMLDVEIAIRKELEKRSGLVAVTPNCIFSDDNSEQLIARIRIPDNVIPSPVGAEESSLTPNNENPVNIMRLLERILLDVKIKGIEGVENARVQLLEDLPMPQDDGTVRKDYSYIIYTAGSNLLDAFNAPHVDYSQTISNHILEVMEVLGIEAARTLVINEINDVLKYAGTYINIRHIELLADVMCREGYLISADRHGMNKSDSGPWARASFEETSKKLFDAAMYAETDPMTGVSANIMFGQPFKGGTNSYSISLDEQVLESNTIPEMPTFQEMAAPGKERMLPETCDFSEDHFRFQLE